LRPDQASSANLAEHLVGSQRTSDRMTFHVDDSSSAPHNPIAATMMETAEAPPLVVWGAGDAIANGEYQLNGTTSNGRQRWSKRGCQINFDDRWGWGIKCVRDHRYTAGLGCTSGDPTTCAYAVRPCCGTDPPPAIVWSGEAPPLVVSGAGDAVANGEYQLNGTTSNGRQRWSKGDCQINFDDRWGWGIKCVRDHRYTAGLGCTSGNPTTCTYTVRPCCGTDPPPAIAWSQAADLATQ